jgi:hypothetical protein
MGKGRAVNDVLVFTLLTALRKVLRKQQEMKHRKTPCILYDGNDLDGAFCGR